VVLLGNGDGTFQAPVNSGAVSPSGQLASEGVPWLAVGDVNGDGKPDLVTGPYTFISSSSVGVLLGNGDGTFQSPVYTNITARLDGGSIVVGDFNGDGKADILAGGLANGNEELVLIPGSVGALIVSSSAGPFPAANAPGALALQDVNGNGRPDLVVAARNYAPYAFLDGSLQPTYSKTAIIVPYGTPLSLAVADIDGDGHPDVVASDTFGNLFLQFGAGDGTFHAPAATPPQTIYTGGAPIYNTATPPAIVQTYADLYDSISAADFRGVGKQDVVMALAGKSVSLLRNGVGSAPVVTAADVVNVASLTAGVVPGSLVAVFAAWRTDPEAWRPVSIRLRRTPCSA
jgi:hypothetical protein